MTLSPLLNIKKEVDKAVIPEEEELLAIGAAALTAAESVNEACAGDRETSV